MTVSSPADFYLNQHQFSDMKLGARNESIETTRAVAEQFESLFVQQMLAAMRSAATVDESRHSSTVDFYQEMYDKQLALSISQQGGLGIAEMLLRQLPGGDKPPLATGKGGNFVPADRVQAIDRVQPGTGLTMEELPATKSKDTSLPIAYQNNAYEAQNPAVKVSKFRTDDLKTDGSIEQSQSSVGSQQRWNEPKNFVSDLWPHAEQAAKTIGISAQALVAQSALETGWGKHTMRFSDGKPAFNVFGIKAGSNWTGATLAKPTLEFRDGVMQTEVAHFRAYDSITQALDDYVEFIQSSPRYQSALQHEGSDERYFDGLQKGGYATDPEYANKIIGIMQGKTLAESSVGLDAEGIISQKLGDNIGA
jgi:flagellar protein FlgJ